LLSSHDRGTGAFFSFFPSQFVKRSNCYAKNDTAHAVRLHGAAARAPAADGAHYGDSAQNLFPLWLYPAGHSRHRSQRGAAGQGRRRDGKADLPLPKRRRRPVPPLRSHRSAGQIRGSALRRAVLPFPPLADRQGVPGRAGPAGPVPGVLSGRHRHHRRRKALHCQRGGDSQHHLPDFLLPWTEAVPDPGEQPEDSERLLRHAGPDRAVRRDHAHRG